jgi:hypothetical protein
MQEKGVMLQDNSMKGPNKSGAKALMNTIMQLRSEKAFLTSPLAPGVKFVP